MAGVKTPTTAEEQDTAHNPAQDLYNREFNASTQTADGSDENTAIAKGQHRDAHGDVVNNNYNADDNIKKVGEKEAASAPPKSAASPTKTSGSLLGKRLKKFGPSGGIIGLIIGIVGLGSIALVPTSLLVMLDRVLTNNSTHDVRANSTMSEARFGTLFNTGNVNKNCTSSKIKCKVSSMSKTEMERWNNQKGVKVIEGKSVFGRTVVRGLDITHPDGKVTEIRNSSQFKQARKNNPYIRNLYWQNHHPRAAFFIGPQSKMSSLLKKYKLSTGKVISKVAGKTKAERKAAIDDSMNARTGAESGEDSKSRIKARIDKVKSKVSNANAKFQSSLAGKVTKTLGNGAGAVSLGCTLYAMHKATLTTIKMSYYIDLIRFFHPFMVAAGQIIQEGDIDPELMENIGDRLTWYQSEATAETAEQKSKIGLTATDSQGFQAALYGDWSKLTEFTKHYTPWYALTAATAGDALRKFEEFVGKGNSLHNVCTTAKYLSYLGLVGWGAAIAGGCWVVDLIADDACSKAILKGLQAGIDQGLKAVYEEMENFQLDADLKGVDLGNAIAAGIGLFLMEKDRGSGLQPARSPSQVTQYLADTNDNYSDYIAALQEDAKDNPFDTSNQYSLASNALIALSQYKAKETTGFSVIANIAAVISSTFLPSKASAGYFQPIESVTDNQSLKSMTEGGNGNKGRSCDDVDMTDIGLLCDWTGRSINVVGSAPMKWAKQMQDDDTTPWEETVDYMATNEYIEDDEEQSGKPKDYDKYKEPTDVESEYKEEFYDNKYLMYKAYCTNDRVYPLGTTMTAIDEDGADKETMGWLTGAKCAGNDTEGNPIGAAFDEMLDRFFFYYNMCETQLGIVDANQKCWEDEPVESSVPSGSTGESVQCGDSWRYPIKKPGTTVTRSMGGGHQGADIFRGNPGVAGDPIFSVCDGVVTKAGGGISGFGYWVQIRHDVNGKIIDTLYGHTKPTVKEGDKVKGCQQIGVTASLAEMDANGGAGGSTGPHLHFERHPGGYNNPQAPEDIINNAKECG
ncbi:MAG: M23 family metallopeptidase [Candidatus Saccharimonadales bacterium]